MPRDAMLLTLLATLITLLPVDAALTPRRRCRLASFFMLMVLDIATPLRYAIIAAMLDITLTRVTPHLTYAMIYAYAISRHTPYLLRHAATISYAELPTPLPRYATEGYVSHVAISLPVIAFSHYIDVILLRLRYAPRAFVTNIR